MLPEGHRRYLGENVTQVEVAQSNAILNVLSGSSLYGTALPGSSDRDEMGVFIEPEEFVFGFKKIDSLQHRTVPEGEKSGPDDVDQTWYSLRHYMSLAVQGNPSVLQLLFAPKDNIITRFPLGTELQALAPYIISKRAYPRFRGYLQSQKLRLMGDKKGHVPSRPELIEMYGYDTKYAMHCLRLGMQGCELFRTGRLILPMEQAEWLIEVRHGLLSYEDAIRHIELTEEDLEYEFNRTSLPDDPFFSVLSEWLTNAHLQWWDRN